LDHTEQPDQQPFLRALRSAGPEATPSPGFEEALLKRLLGQVANQDTAAPQRAQKGRKSVWAWRAMPAVAAMLLLALGFWWLLGADIRYASADFSEMLKNVREATTAAFDLTCRVPGEPVSRARVQMAYPGRARVTWSDDGRIHIVDGAQRKILALTPATMTANRRPVTVEAAYDEPLQRLKAAGESAGQLVGTETWDDRKITVYRLQQGQVTLHVWVDAGEELPVRIESRSRTEDGQEATVVLDNFRWNLPVCESQFSLEIPAGYTEGRPSETALIELLRICARASGGSFPEKLDGPAVLNLIETSKPGSVYAEKGPDGQEVTGMSDEGRETFKACLRGLAFVSWAIENGTWHYCGGGAKLGDPTAVVCWWRPTGSTMSRAVYGDLTVRDLVADMRRASEEREFYPEKDK